MLNYIWGGMIIISLLCAIVTGRIENLSGAIFSGANSAIKLILSIIGMMALWTGLMKIAEKSEFTSLIAKFYLLSRRSFSLSMIKLPKK